MFYGMTVVTKCSQSTVISDVSFGESTILLITDYFAKQKTYKTEGAIYTVSLRFTQKEPTSRAVSHANVPCFVRLLSQRNREVVIVAAPRPIAHMGVDAAIPLLYKVSTVTCTTLRKGDRDKHTNRHTHRYAFCPKDTH